MCTNCSTNYALYPNGSCVFYPNNCLNFSYSKELEKVVCYEIVPGFYIKNNIFYRCSYSNSGCKKCKYEYNNLICEEVEQGYYLSENKSKSCNATIPYCKICSYHSENDLNDNIIKCDQCYLEKYISSDERECKDCRINHLVGEGCIICSDEEKYICDKCSRGYILNSRNICIKCGENCLDCFYSQYDLSLRCNNCLIGYFSDYDGKCQSCEEIGKLDACENCQIYEDQKYICQKCKKNYILYNYQCSINCSFLFDPNSEFYINDLDEKDKNNINKCSLCQKNEKNEFECFKCKDNNIFFNGLCIEKKGDLSNCEEVENLGTNENPIYSCLKCRNNTYIFAIKDNLSKICVEQSEDLGLLYCKLSKKESNEENNFTCIECQNNMQLEYDEIKQKTICKKCEEGFYLDKYYSICKLCNIYSSHCAKCQINEDHFICEKCEKGYAINNYFGCDQCPYYCLECFYDEYNQLKCSSYKEPFFLSNNNTIEACNEQIDNCMKCSYSNLDKNKLLCDKCYEDYFINKDGICEHCTINKHYGKKCVSCTDIEEKKKQYPCQKCLGGFFLTKENICVNCKVYGGESCIECGYIMINGTENIGCIRCERVRKLTEKGLCLSIDRACLNYEIRIEKNITKAKCLSCIDNYDFGDYFKERYFCYSYMLKDCLNATKINGKRICLTCKIGFELKQNECINKKIIEGCLKYEVNENNNYFCSMCDVDYFYYYGNCYKKPNNPFLENCNKFSFNNNKGLFQCDYCENGFGFVDESKMLCYNKYLNCKNVINLGTDAMPKYSCDENYTFSDEHGVIWNYTDDIFNNSCKRGNVNTSYYEDNYTCIECKREYILSYSNYYEKNICKDKFYKEKVNRISYSYDIGIPAINGVCDDNYFTRNGKTCIKCDDNIIGMPGCGGKCTFIKDRKNQLQCEINKCKEYFFEIFPGKCEYCQSIIKNCKTCSYIINNEIPIFKPVRKRDVICTEYLPFNCDEIEEGCQICVIENNEKKCLKKDVKKPKNKEEYIFFNNTYLTCDEYFKMQNCLYCDKDRGCYFCQSGFFYISNLNSCIETID